MRTLLLAVLIVFITATQAVAGDLLRIHNNTGTAAEFWIWPKGKKVRTVNLSLDRKDSDSVNLVSADPFNMAVEIRGERYFAPAIKVRKILQHNPQFELKLSVMAAKPKEGSPQDAELLVMFRFETPDGKHKSYVGRKRTRGRR
ncbi:MAG: hypothetical protein K8R46_07620 [Pirellulales bacterium]|nr:hypothetical protein [Pirellulales bacterium]